MKKFVSKFILITLFANIPLFLYVEFGMAYFFNTDYPLYTYMRDYALGEPSTLLKNSEFHVKDPEILYMGDSTVVYGINPKYIEAKSQNISLAGASVIEMYYLLKMYYSNNKAPKQIFLSISQTAFEWADALAPRTMKTHILTVNDLYETINNSVMLDSAPYDYSISIKKYEGVLDAVAPVNVKANPLEQYAQFLLYRMNFIYYYSATIANGRYFRNYDTNIAFYNNLDKNQGFRSIGTHTGSPALVNKAAFTDREHFYPAKLHIHYWDKFLALAAVNNTQVIFEAMPVNSLSYNKLHTKTYFIKEYNDLLINMQNKYPMHIISHEMPIFDDMYYADGTHFNESGAKIYSLYLKNKYF